MVLEILLMLSPIVLIWLIGFMFSCRINWVGKEVLKLLENDSTSYHKLPTYETMFFKFWIWDVRKFIEEDSNVK